MPRNNHHHINVNDDDFFKLNRAVNDYDSGPTNHDHALGPVVVNVVRAARKLVNDNWPGAHHDSGPGSDDDLLRAIAERAVYVGEYTAKGGYEYTDNGRYLASINDLAAAAKRWLAAHEVTS